MFLEYIAKHKVTILLITIIILLIGIVLLLSLQLRTKPSETFLVPEENNATTSSPVSETKPRTHTYLENKTMERAVLEYLSAQETFIWKTKSASHVLCSVENLLSDNELFPLYLFTYCAEYELENETLRTLSAFSGPVKVNYPNEFSYYDMSKFSHESPRDGSYFSEDVKRIFPTEVQGVIITFDTENIVERNETVALEQIRKWHAITSAIKECKVDTVFQTHNRQVTVQLKDGSELRTTQPNIDDVLKLAVQAEETCDPIMMSTE